MHLPKDKETVDYCYLKEELQLAKTQVDLHAML